MVAKKIFKFVFIPLLFGWLLYQFRPFGNGLIDFVKIKSDRLMSVGSALPDFCIYNLPDGLWAFSLTSCIFLIWRGRSFFFEKIWTAVTVLFICSLELFQKIDLLPGTFDVLDLGTMLFGCFLSFLIFRDYEKSDA